MDSAAVVGVILGDGSLERLLGALARDQELNTREFLDKLSSAVSSSLSSTATRKESQGILRALGHHLSLLTEARTTSPFNARLVMFYLEMLSLLLPFTSPWPVFELHWTPLIEPLLALNGQKIVYSPNALQQGHDWLRELLLKEALMVSPNTPSITTFLLSLLHSEDENQALKQAVEDLLLDFAMTGSMTHFCACLGSLAVKAQYRLSLFVLLTRLLTREAVPVYLILESSVLPLVLESCIVRCFFLILVTLSNTTNVTTERHASADFKNFFGSIDHSPFVNVMSGCASLPKTLEYLHALRLLG